MKCLISDISVCAFKSSYLQLNWSYFTKFASNYPCLRFVKWFCEGFCSLVQLNVSQISSCEFWIHLSDVMQRYVQGLTNSVMMYFVPHLSLSIKIPTFVLKYKIRPCSDAQWGSGILNIWLLKLQRHVDHVCIGESS